MSKKIYFLFLIAFVLCFSLPITAFGTSNTEVELFAPKKSEFVDLNSPYAYAKSGTTQIFFDTDGIKISKNDEISFISTQNTYTHPCPIIYSNKLFAINSNEQIDVFDLNTNSMLLGHTLSNLVQVRWISLSGSNLYVLDSNGANSYDLTTDNPSPVFIQNLTSQILLFDVVSNELVYTENIQGTKYLVCGQEKVQINDVFNDISVDDKIYGLSNSNLSIKIYDKTTLAELGSIAFDNVVSDINVCDGKLYATDKSNNCIKVYSLNSNSPTYFSTICAMGKAIGKFNTPVSIYAHSSAVLVADKLNKRIQVFNTDGSISDTHNLLTWNSEHSPLSIVEYNGKYYALTSNGVQYVKGYETKTFTSSEFSNPKTLAIDCFGTVYLCDDNKIFAKTESATVFSEFVDVTAVDIAISPKGSVLYALSNNVIFAYDSLGSLIFSSPTNKTFSNSAKIDSDVSGNMYIVDGSTLYKFDRSVSGFTFSFEKDLTYKNAPISCSDISLSPSGTVYLTSSEKHCIYSLSHELVNSAIYNPNGFTPPINAYEKTALSLPAGYVKVNSNNAFAYDFAQSYENARIVPADTVLLLLDNAPTNDFYYVYYSGKDCYIHSSYVTALSPTAFTSYDGFALHSTKVYKYPVVDQTGSFALVDMPNGTEFKVVGNANNYTCLSMNGQNIYWNEILYNDKIYYIERNHIAMKNLSREVDYGVAKICTDAVGKKVPLYALPDEASAIIGEYTDGTEVKLLTEIDNASTFTEVQIGDKIGFVKTSNLTTNGLTIAQIVILIIILLGGTGSVVILIINRKMHRRN